MIQKLDWLATKLHRVLNFPFFVGLMAFLVPHAYFEGEVEDLDSLWTELVDAWVILRDDSSLSFLFAATFLLAGFISIKGGMSEVSFQKKEEEVRSP